MKHFVLGALIASATAALSFVSPASAVDQSFVSGTGNDANPCTRASPCQNFGTAIAATAAGGEIICLDAGQYSTFVISKAIKINCQGTVGAIVNNHITVNAGPADVVTLLGLDLTGVPFDTFPAINFTSGAELHLSNVSISKFFNGVAFAPTANAKLFVSDSLIQNNGQSNSNAGILIRPTGGASANVSLTNVKLQSNTNGVFFDGSGGAGPCNLNVNGSLVSGSSNTGIAIGSSAPFTAMIDNSVLSFNANSGLGVSGASATVVVSGSTIANNVNGLVAVNGASVQSMKNNAIALNTNNGTPLTPFPGPGGTPLQ
jgi:hypothetical protein